MIYLSTFTDIPPRIPDGVTEVNMASIEEALAMFKDQPVTLRRKRMVVVSLGGDRRMAITDYRLI